MKKKFLVVLCEEIAPTHDDVYTWRFWYPFCICYHTHVPEPGTALRIVVILHLPSMRLDTNCGSIEAGGAHER
jgi:hypothetical protein